MSTINGRACVVNGMPVDKVFSDGKQVYGRNLVTGTSNELKTVTASGWGSSPISLASGKYGAGRYYVSIYIENTTPVGVHIVGQIVDHINGIRRNINGNYIQAGQSGISSLELDILEGQSLDSLFLGFDNLQTESYTYKYKEIMIKRTPSPWTPAPEDVM